MVAAGVPIWMNLGARGSKGVAGAFKLGVVVVKGQGRRTAIRELVGWFELVVRYFRIRSLCLEFDNARLLYSWYCLALG